MLELFGGFSLVIVGEFEWFRVVGVEEDGIRGGGGFWSKVGDFIFILLWLIRGLIVFGKWLFGFRGLKCFEWFSLLDSKVSFFFLNRFFLSCGIRLKYFFRSRFFCIRILFLRIRLWLYRFIDWGCRRRSIRLRFCFIFFWIWRLW